MSFRSLVPGSREANFFFGKYEKKKLDDKPNAFNPVANIQEENLKCFFCQRSFASVNGYNQHLKKKHVKKVIKRKCNVCKAHYMTYVGVALCSNMNCSTNNSELKKNDFRGQR